MVTWDSTDEITDSDPWVGDLLHRARIWEMQQREHKLAKFWTKYCWICAGVIVVTLAVTWWR